MIQVLRSVLVRTATVTMAFGSHEDLARTMANIRAQPAQDLSGEEEQHAECAHLPECAVTHVYKLLSRDGAVKSFAGGMSSLAGDAECRSMAAHAFSPDQR